MEFKNPIVFLLIPIAAGIIWYFYRKQKLPSFRFSSNRIVHSLPKTWKIRFSFIPFVFRCVVLVLIIVGLAGPRTVLEESVDVTEGIDIVLSMDASGSMAAEDFVLKGKRLNRLDIVKTVMAEFVDKRTNDKIGLIAFADKAYTVCPLTTDYQWLKQNLERVTLGLIGSETAIGSAIASSISRLKQSEATSKIIVLLTDGVNNAGKIEPIEAAKIAQAHDIKIYTIGAGTKGTAPFPTTDFFGRKVYRKYAVNIDEATLKEVSQITGGKYFRATDTESLKAIYDEIDQLEKSEIEELGYFQYEEYFQWLVLAALVFLLVELILSKTIFIRVP